MPIIRNKEGAKKEVNRIFSNVKGTKKEIERIICGINGTKVTVFYRNRMEEGK